MVIRLHQYFGNQICINKPPIPVGFGCIDFESLYVGKATGLVDGVEELQGEHQEPLVGQAQGLVDLTGVLVPAILKRTIVKIVVIFDKSCCKRQTFLSGKSIRSPSQFLMKSSCASSLRALLRTFLYSLVYLNLSLFCSIPTFLALPALQKPSMVRIFVCMGEFP